MLNLIKSKNILVLFSVLSLLTPWKIIVSKTFFILSPIVFKSELKLQAKEITRIANIARQITVKIEGPTQGTGVIVKKNENEYTVLTAWHVIKEFNSNEDIDIITFDGISHQLENKTIRRIERTDLAVFKFKSKIASTWEGINEYKVANLGDDQVLDEGDEVFVSGFPIISEYLSERVFRLRSGNVVSIDNANSNKDKYKISYSNPTLPGMSGGPLLDVNGYLVGIHGRAEINKDLSKNSRKLVATGINKGIPISYYNKFIKQFESTNKESYYKKEVKKKDFYFGELSCGTLDNYNTERYVGLIGGMKYDLRVAKKHPDRTNENEMIKIANEMIRKIRKCANPDLMPEQKKRKYFYTTRQKLYKLLAEAHYYKGYALTKLKNYSEALREFEKAIEVSPNPYVDYYHERGNVKYALNDNIGAIKDLSFAIKANPSNSGLWLSRARIKYQSNDFNGAIQDLNEGIFWDQDSYGKNFVNIQLFYERCKVNYLMEEFRNALSDCNKAISAWNKRLNHSNHEFFWNFRESNDYYGKIYFKRGKIKIALNDKKSACVDFKQAIYNGSEKSKQYLNSEDGLWCLKIGD